MTGIVGSVWTMRDNLTDIAWTARTTLHEASVGIDDPLLSLSWEKQVKAALADDLHTTLPTAPDVYGFGKEIARMARLALIADELGEGSSFLPVAGRFHVACVAPAFVLRGGGGVFV